MTVPAKCVTIATGARVHFGLLTHRPQSGREFGGAGLMVDSPGWQISMSRADSDSCDVSPELLRIHPDCLSRVQQLLDRLRCADTEDSQSAGTSREVAVEIKSGIPAHQGLGAGSQLALALACGLDRLSGRRSSVQELSHRAGRGGRSAIGTWGFEHGGLLCDGGRADSGAADRLAPLVARVAVPEQWRFVLLLPTDSCGLSGPEEAAAFRQLKGVPDADTDRLCRIILMQLVPAFREAEFEEAATAIGEYGRVAGRYFSEIQCGLFTHPKLAALAASLAEYGGQGLAQTSWGPGCAVLCRNQTMAEKLSGLAVSQGAGWLTTQIVQGLNRGATIECH